MKRIFLVILLIGFVFSCNDRFEEMNRPKKNAGEVPGEFLFSNGLREMFDLMASSDVNTNIFRLFSQYWAQTTYPDESQYNLVGREISDNFFDAAFKDVLKDLDLARATIQKQAEKLGMSEAEKNNQVAIVNICKAYMYAVLVDAFGAVPYTEALQEDILSPKYEGGQEIYNAIIDSLNLSIAALDTGAAGFSSAQDFVYGGGKTSIINWKKFGNSLKLRLAINIADLDPAKAQTLIDQALASGIITSDTESFTLKYYATSPNTNPVWEDLVQSGRADFVAANTLVEKLTELSDPRLAVYADPVEGTSNYVGGIYGSGNAYDDFSHVGELFHTPDLKMSLIDYAHVEFLLAEAAARNLVVPGTAEDHYKAAIQASWAYWEVTGDFNTYYAQPAVAYTPADWKQKIGTQEWIHFFNNGFEGWTTWRRLDFTGLKVPEGLTENDIPRRLTFPIEEATLNQQNMGAAAQLVGADVVQSKVFWDVN